MDFTVTFRLEGPRLICEMAGRPDRPTPINLASHTYYNLGGDGDVKDHALWVDADAYTPTDAALIPTGEIRPVEGTAFDFTSEREIGDTILDQNVVMREARDRKKPGARVRCPRTSRRLELWTDEPGLQLFDAPEMVIAVPGHDGRHYGRFAGLCLEAQHFPDSVHHPEWPSIISTPDRPYFQAACRRDRPRLSDAPAAGESFVNNPWYGNRCQPQSLVDLWAYFPLSGGPPRWGHNIW